MVIAVVVLCTQACAPERAPDAVMTVRDSAGVRIVEHTRGSLDKAETWKVLDTVWSLAGTPEVAPGFPTSIIDAILIDTLHVGVLSRADHEVFIFSRGTGAPVAVGRAGDGPGEFRSPAQLIHWTGDEFGVWDDAASAITVYDADGNMVDRTSLPPQYTIQRGQRLVGRRGDGGIVAPITPLELEVMGERRHPLVDGLHQDSLHLRVFPLGASAPLDLFSLSGVDLVGTGNGHFTNEFPPLLARRPLAAIAGGQVVVASADRFVLRYLIAKDVVQQVRLAYQPRPATREATDQAIQAWVASVRRRSPMFRRPRDDDPSPLTIRDTLPVFAGLVGEASGALWVALYPPDYSERIWLSVSRQGKLSGRINFGAQVEVLDAASPFLLVREPEAFGLTSLHLLRVGAGSGV